MKTKRVVVFVDVQNDFVKGGALAYGYPSNDIVPRIADYAKHCCDEGDFIIFTMDTHDEDYLATLEGKKLPVPHCIEGTHGWELAPAIKEVIYGNPLQNIRTFTKTTFGCQALPQAVKDVRDERGGLDEIVVCGLMAEICVLANVVLLRTSFPNTKISVKAELCGSVSKEDYEASMRMFNALQIEVI